MLMPSVARPKIVGAVFVLLIAAIALIATHQPGGPRKDQPAIRIETDPDAAMTEALDRAEFAETGTQLVSAGFAGPGREHAPGEVMPANTVADGSTEAAQTLEELLATRGELVMKRDELISIVKKDAIGAVSRMVFPDDDERETPRNGPEVFIVTGGYNGERYYIFETRVDRPELFRIRDEIRRLESIPDVRHALEIDAALAGEEFVPE